MSLRLSRRGLALAIQIVQWVCHVSTALTEHDRSALGMSPKSRRA